MATSDNSFAATVLFDLMDIISAMQLNHGKCEPRSDRSCSRCNAIDDLIELSELWRKHKTRIQNQQMNSNRFDIGQIDYGPGHIETGRACPESFFSLVRAYSRKVVPDIKKNEVNDLLKHFNELLKTLYESISKKRN